MPRTSGRSLGSTSIDSGLALRDDPDATEAMDSVSPLGGDGGYVGIVWSFGSSKTDGAADVFGLSGSPISWLYMLESSGSELRSVSRV